MVEYGVKFLCTLYSLLIAIFFKLGEEKTA
jgi:hypothetical protein